MYFRFRMTNDWCEFFDSRKTLHFDWFWLGAKIISNEKSKEKKIIIEKSFLPSMHKICSVYNYRFIRINRRRIIVRIIHFPINETISLFHLTWGRISLLINSTHLTQAINTEQKKNLISLQMHQLPQRAHQVFASEKTHRIV